MKLFIIANKKLLIIASLIVVVLAGAATAVFAFPDEKPKDKIVLELIGNNEVSINLEEIYEEFGIKVFVNDVEEKREYIITGDVDNTKPGTYVIKYRVDNIEISRLITVVDNIEPILTLKGKESMVVLENDKYEEPGCEAIDNIDGDITNKVEIIGKVETNKVGEYKLIYKVSDEAGNEVKKERIVKVQKKLVVQQAPVEVKQPPKKEESTLSNEIASMSYTSNGISVRAKYSYDVKSFYLKEINSDTKYNYSVTKSGNDYTSNINLSTLSNGSYDLYIEHDSEEKVISKLGYLYQLGRTKIGDKLVTFNYDNNNVRIMIENFAYQYDILIDPGHGGGDPGAVNEYIQERAMNLEVSLYEKARYEAHGLKVLMTRADNTPTLQMGSSESELYRRVYAMGYYGVVTRIIYSNHHNNSTNKNLMGYEVLVPAGYTKEQLANEHRVIAAWQSIYNLTENHNRFYTRNYDTGAVYSKLNGEVYTFNNYYAVNRVPNNLFNVKAVIYEGCYMSNNANYNWYYIQENWKKISEAKIKVYVESLGKTYLSVN